MQCPHVHLVMQTLCLRVEAGSIPTGGAIRTTAMAAAETPNLLRVGSIPSVRATGPLTSNGKTLASQVRDRGSIPRRSTMIRLQMGMSSNGKTAVLHAAYGSSSLPISTSAHAARRSSTPLVWERDEFDSRRGLHFMSSERCVWALRERGD